MKVRRIPFSPDEWLAGTAELSPYDRGVYITICALIYSRGERIGIELLARHCGVHGNALNASLARLETTRKIVRNGSEIGQKRCENELEIAQKSSGNASEIAGEVNKINEVTKMPRARATEYNLSTSTPLTSTPVAIAPGVGVRSPQRGARLPQDVELSGEWVEAAQDARMRAALPDVDLATEFEKFRNHWLSKSGADATKLDWKRTWVNWALRANPPRNGGGTPMMNFYEGAMRAADEYTAWQERQEQSRDNGADHSSSHRLLDRK